MKPFENWNPKSLVLIGASLGAGVLLLLAAVPSQTDFDGAYFKTNSLPISLTGYLTNWAKLDTNASGGDTIWTTNADGVISPLGTGQLTNILRFTSGLADNATNVAFIVDTMNAWSAGDNEKLLSLRNQGTNVAYITEWGALEIGRNIGPAWGPDRTDFIAAVHDQAFGEAPIAQLFFKATDDASSETNSTTFRVRLDSGVGRTAYINFFRDDLVGEQDFGVALSDALLNIVLSDKAGQKFEVNLTAADGAPAYILQTSMAHSTGSLLDLANDTTNKVSVLWDGSITTGGNTNRWILGGVTNGAPDVSVDGTHYPLAVTDSPAITGTPTINGSNVMVWPTQVTLAHAGNVSLDFTAYRTECNFTGCTGAVNFVSANLAANHTYTLYGLNTNSVSVVPTFPAWNFQGGIPSTITAGKTFTLLLNSRGTVDTNVWAFFTIQN